MAYGKIKADTLVYDNSGTDVEKSISDLVNSAPLNSPVFTGTPTVPGYMPLAGGTVTGDLQIDNAKKFILSETDANGTHYLSFKAPDSVTATVDFTLPDGAGSAGQLLQTNGSGTLSWSTTDLSAYAPLAAPALTGTATGVNLTLSGDLTVNGTTTTVNQTNLDVSDNIIGLNRGASTNANDSGIIIERGSTGDNAIIAWDESADKFTVGTTTGTASSTGNITIAAAPLVASTVEDSKGDVRTIPASSSATNVLPADAGKFIPISAGIILDTNTAFTAGQAVTIYNDQGASNDEVITVTGVTLYLATDPAASGNRTLAGRGIATILCTAANTYVISGAGLS